MSPKKICVYCGRRPGETIDHVPPQGWFPPAEKGSLVRLPACKACNGRHNQAEEEFRNLLGMVRGPDGGAVYEKFLRSLTYAPSTRARLVAALHDWHGETAVPVMRTWLRPLFVKVALGLFVHEYDVVGTEHLRGWAILDPSDPGDAYRAAATVRRLTPSFEYSFRGDTDTSIWWLDIAGAPPILVTLEVGSRAWWGDLIYRLSGGRFA